MGSTTKTRRELVDAALRDNGAERESLVNASLSASSSASSKVQNLSLQINLLKVIDILKFNSDIRKFIEFRGLFENMMHSNSSLSNVQKLY